MRSGYYWCAWRPRRRYPFEIKTPTAETAAAMTELEQGKAARFDNVADLMADLNAED